MSGFSVHVAGLAPETTEEKLVDFLSFCGQVKSVQMGDKSADVVFTKESAAKTALMLNGGTLDGAHLEVTSSNPSATAATGALPSGADANTPIGASSSATGVDGSLHLEQEDKPAAGIMAEYLAAGYAMSDALIERAIEMDRKQGISARFMQYINQLDNKVGETVVGHPDQKASTILAGHLGAAVHKTKEFDEQKGITARIMDVYSKALNSNTGQKVLQFYTSTTKGVLDVHEEAKRIASEKKATHGSAGAAHELAHEAAPAFTETADAAAARTQAATARVGPA
ncbi:hypothetical protein QFC21_001022 [Naganishia friedmannii]|uniref:Uncharacterized protein n=1 Tax=Naganishia friedmannii TaxID=89922 RepID=A0ACC2W7Y5_9TREE|nr:hypothetical protein QFC21_001022 [Naganishia friedmannii]